MYERYVAVVADVDVLSIGNRNPFTEFAKYARCRFEKILEGV